MAEYFSSLFCCSCCGSCSPSPPRQPPISVSSPQLPPHQQPITGHSTTSSPSQPSEQEATMTDFKIFLQKFNDRSQIDGLIRVLEELLKIASGEKSDGGSNSAGGSYIQDGQRILEMLDKRIGKRTLTTNSRDGAIEEIGKVFIEGLKGAEKIPTVGIALSMLGSVLARFTQMFDNKSECLEVLRRMLDLAKHVWPLNEQIPDQEQKLNEVVKYIVEGTTMCISQLANANIFRFLTATVNADCLKEFQVKIDRLYLDIQLSTAIGIGERVIDIGKRVPKLASESQKLYAYQPTVGIESGLESVIQLLDLNSQDTVPIVVVVYGFGGIGKTTLADAVYAQLNLQSYKHCRIHMDQGCTKNDLKDYQQQILYGLFSEELKLKNCDEGQARLCSFFKKNPNQPLFLYIDNGLKSTDLKQLLPKGLGSYLPPKSRVLVTTRNLHETDIFVGRNIQRRQYAVSPLPKTEARKILLEKVLDYDDENNIDNLLKLCDGVPLLLELAGSQLAINRKNTRSIVLEMLREGKEVKEGDISDRMVGFVYDRLSEPVQEAFLDIASFFYDWPSKDVTIIVREEEFKDLEAASFVKTGEYGNVIVHDIVRARGKKLSEQEGNRITDSETLLECLKDEKKLKNLKGIYIRDENKQHSIEINSDHLNCMSNLLRVFCYEESHITFMGKCHKPFEQLRCLRIWCDVPDLPMEFEKLEHLVYYKGPLTQGMSLYEFPPSLRFILLQDYSENRVAYSKIPPKVTPASSLVRLHFQDFKNMQRLPDGVEKLTKLEQLMLWNCNELRELPSKLSDFSNLKELRLCKCYQLKELPSDFGQLKNLKELTLFECPQLKELPSDFGQLKNLEKLSLHECLQLKELPSDFGQLKNLKELTLFECPQLKELPSDFGQLKNLEELTLFECPQLKELPSDFGQLKNLEKLNLHECLQLKELPSDFGQLKNLEELILFECPQLKELPSNFGDLTELKEIDLTGCSSKLKDLLPNNLKGNNCNVFDFKEELKEIDDQELEECN